MDRQHERPGPASGGVFYDLVSIVRVPQSMRKRATPSRRRKFNWGKKEEDIYREGQPFKSAEHIAQRINVK